MLTVAEIQHCMYVATETFKVTYDLHVYGKIAIEKNKQKNPKKPELF